MSFEGIWYAGENGRALVHLDGVVTGDLPHIVYHSPAGFGHGYEGSGPADLARSLLAHALGDDASCADCRGTSVADDGTTCWSCNGGIKPLPYQEFKREVVATWPQDQPWQVSRAEILRWLDGRL